MRIFSIYLLGFLALAIAFPSHAAEIIHRYDTRVTVQQNGALDITETIEVTAEGRDIKRGIYRDFPTHRRTFMGGVLPSPHGIISVKKDGVPEPYHTETSDTGNYRLYIGSSNVFLPTGKRYTYEIRYRVPDQVFFFDDYDELFWNVIGTDWAFPIVKGRAEIILPKGAEPIDIAAYTGGNLSKDSNAKISSNFNRVIVETSRPLAAREGMSVAVSFPTGYVVPGEDMLGTPFFWKQHPGLGYVFLCLLAMALYYWWAWDKYGRDPKGRGIIARYDPPPGISPAMAAYIREMGGASTKQTLTSAIMSLASKGYLEITELKKKRYQIKRTDKEETVDNLMSDDESLVYREIGKSVTLSRSSKTMMRVAKEHGEILASRCKKKYFHINFWWWAVGLIPILTAVGILIAVSPASKGALSGSLLFTLVFGGAGGGAFIWGLIQVIKGGLSQKFQGIFMMIWGAGFSMGGIIGIVTLVNTVSWLVLACLVAMVALAVLMFTLMKAPTPIGKEVMDHIEGFRMYMKAVEEKVLQKFDPPQMSRELYEKYLPYAVALDVESKWADKFALVAAGAATAAAASGTTNFSPTWYHSSGGSTSLFSISDMANSISSSIASASSSSSSSGGGSSGGGGGGGGGGGW